MGEKTIVMARSGETNEGDGLSRRNRSDGVGEDGSNLDSLKSG